MQKEFYLSALIDFPDDVLYGMTKRESVVDLLQKLKECNVKRIFWYYYGKDDDSYYSNASNPGENYGNFAKMLANIPSFNRFVVDTAHRLGMEIVGVMRNSESGNAALYSEFYPEMREAAKRHQVKSLGGYVGGPNKYLQAHPESRIKRRTFDIDSAAEKMNISKIELRKQNDLPTKIRKENIKIYVSDNNYNYREYEGDFSFEIGNAVCDVDVWVAKDDMPYRRKRITKSGDRVTTIVLSGFEIEEGFVAVTCNCGASGDPENAEIDFLNTLSNSISCYAKDGTVIPISVGNDFKIWGDPKKRSWKECGLAIDNGFGDYFDFGFDIPGKECVIGFAKGKNRYVHSHLCECDEGVQKYWLEALESCINNGFDMITSREENHSIMINDAFAFGYNDSVKEKYFARYGKCEEKDMDPQKIAKIRGDVYSELFIEGAKRVREMGKKVALTLNLEMLHYPIPLERIFAYPMNVEWQWRRWLEEIKPDEIVIRTYRYSPEFVFGDSQSMEIINTAKALNVPMTYERYVNMGDFIADCKIVKETGIFDSVTLYETATLFGVDNNGKVFAKNPELIKALKEL